MWHDLELGVDLEIGHGDECLNFLLALRDESQNWCLHAPHRDKRPIAPRQSSGGVDANQPVCLRTRQRRPAQVIISRFRTDMLESITDTLISVGGKPQA